MNKAITQRQRVRDYMAEFGSITQLEALRDLGVMRLASRISDLRRDGVAISVEMTKGKNRYGQTTKFATYRLIEENNTNG